MHRIALRGMGVLILAAVIMSFAGCSGPIFRMKVVNEGDFPLTSVRLVPFIENEERQEQAFEEAVNLLRRDANDVTIAVDVGEIVLLPHILRGDLYYVQVAFFVAGEYVENGRETLVELREIEKNTLVTMYVKCEYPGNATEPEFSFFFEY